MNRMQILDHQISRLTYARDWLLQQESCLEVWANAVRLKLTLLEGDAVLVSGVEAWDRDGSALMLNLHTPVLNWAEFQQWVWEVIPGLWRLPSTGELWDREMLIGYLFYHNVLVHWPIPTLLPPVTRITPLGSERIWNLDFTYPPTHSVSEYPQGEGTPLSTSITKIESEEDPAWRFTTNNNGDGNNLYVFRRRTNGTYPAARHAAEPVVHYTTAELIAFAKSLGMTHIEYRGKTYLWNE